MMANEKDDYCADTPEQEREQNIKDVSYNRNKRGRIPQGTEWEPHNTSLQFDGQVSGRRPIPGCKDLFSDIESQSTYEYTEINAPKNLPTEKSAIVDNRIQNNSYYLNHGRITPTLKHDDGQNSINLKPMIPLIKYREKENKDLKISGMKSFKDLEITKRNKQIEELQQQLNKQVSTQRTLEKKLQETKAICREAEQQVKAHINEIQQLQKELNDKDRENKELQKKVNVHANTFEDRENTDRIMQRCLIDSGDIKHQLQSKHSKIDEKSSSYAMDNQMSNNSALDHRDKNRQITLKERYKKLYDNEWSDAFEIVLSYSKTERDCVETLAQILIEAKLFCDMQEAKQDDLVKEALLLNRKSKTIPDHINKQLKCIISEMSETNVEEICTRFIESVSKPSDVRRIIRLEMLQDYVTECIEICLLMSFHDPSVVFGKTPSKMIEFDTRVYNSYIESGLWFCHP